VSPWSMRSQMCSKLKSLEIKHFIQCGLSEDCQKEKSKIKARLKIVAAPKFGSILTLKYLANPHNFALRNFSHNFALRNFSTCRAPKPIFNPASKSGGNAHLRNSRILLTFPRKPSFIFQVVSRITSRKPSEQKRRLLKLSSPENPRKTLVMAASNGPSAGHPRGTAKPIVSCALIAILSQQRGAEHMKLVFAPPSPKACAPMPI